MEDAAHIAYSELVKCLSLTQAGEPYVGNMVDITYSLVARCSKRHLS